MFRKYFTALIFGMGILTLFGSSDVMAVSCKKPGTNTTILCEGCSPVPNAQTACSCPSDKRTKCSHDGGVQVLHAHHLRQHALVALIATLGKVIKAQKLGTNKTNVF